MTEQLDQDLRSALKQGNHLKGWEFSPEMRRKVMDRVRAEGAGGAAPQPAVRRPLTLPRPLIWVTVAAAALIIAVRVGGSLGGFGGGAMQKDAAPSTTATSAAPPSAAQAAKSLAAPAPAGAIGAASGQAPTESTNVTTRDAAGPATRLIVLPLPPAAPKVAEDGQPKAETPALKAAAPRMDIVTARNLAVQAAGTQVAELQSSGLRIVDAAGAELLNRPLEGISDRSLVAISPEGRVAISAGNKVYLLGRSGQVDSTLDIAAEASGLTWSPDGRVAVADAANVAVIEAGKLKFRMAVAPDARIAFSADGRLAVLSRDGARRRLTVLDRQGQQAMETTVEDAGDGLAFSPDGNVVVAAGDAFDRAGNRLWSWPTPPSGIAMVPGQPLMVAWDARSVAGILPAGGGAVWQAQWNGGAGGFRKAVTAPDGQLIAVLADADGGAVVWVLTPDGAVVYSERLASPPVDVALVGRMLAILDPANLSLRVVR